MDTRRAPQCGRPLSTVLAAPVQANSAQLSGTRVAADGLDRICRGFGGLTRSWRLDRMTTVCHPDSGRITARFASGAEHYGVAASICPPRAGNRKDLVEKSNHTAAAGGAPCPTTGSFLRQRHQHQARIFTLSPALHFRKSWIVRNQSNVLGNSRRTIGNCSDSVTKNYRRGS